MSPTAIIMMVVAILTLWGGLVATPKYPSGFLC